MLVEVFSNKKKQSYLVKTDDSEVHIRKRK